MLLEKFSLECKPDQLFANLFDLVAYFELPRPEMPCPLLQSQTGITCPDPTSSILLAITSSADSAVADSLQPPHAHPEPAQESYSMHESYHHSVTLAKPTRQPTRQSPSPTPSSASLALVPAASSRRTDSEWHAYPWWGVGISPEYALARLRGTSTDGTFIIRDSRAHPDK